MEGKTKNLRRLIAVILVLACLAGAAAVLSSCVTEKYDAFIEAGSIQRVTYDGEVHYPAARLNHDETALVYSGGDVGYGGCREPGEYTITISAAETDNYKAVSTTVTLIIERNELNGDVFEQMIERMKNSGDFNLDENIAVDVALDLSFRHQDSAYRNEDWNYTLKIKGNIDFPSVADTVLAISLYDNNAKADILSMGYDGAAKALYLTAGKQRYKIENADLMNALISASGADKGGGIDEEKLSEHIKQAAATVLASGEVSADGDVYTFDFHMDNLFTSTVAAVAEAFMPGVGEQAGRLLYGMLKDRIWSGFSANLPGISGTLEIKFDGNDFAGISLGNLDYADQSEEGVFFGNVESASMGNSVTVDSEGLLPSDTSAYSASKLLNVSAQGTLGIVQSGSEKGRLGWSLYANMDLAQFIISGGDFSDPALQDNMFHISLWYDPEGQNSSAWANSGDRAEALSSAANIVDIVFDPKNTGTSMVYVSFAPLTLMNDKVTELINGVSNGHYDRISSMFADYSMLQLDINAVVSSMAFNQGETSEAFDALGGAIGFASRLMSIVDIAGGTGVVNISDLAEVLDGDFGDDPFEMDFSLGDFVQALFSAGGSPSDSLQITLTDYELFGSAATEHNAVTGGLVNNFDGTAKTYYDHNNDSRNDSPVMTPHIQGTEDEEGRFFISLYKQSLPNAVQLTVYDKSNPDLDTLSAEEAEAIDEFAIGYTYTDIYGNLNENIYTARIIRIEGYDPSVTGPQQVTIYTEPVEGYNIITNVDNMLRTMSDHKISFEGYRLDCWIDAGGTVASAKAKTVYSTDSEVTPVYSGGEEITVRTGDVLVYSNQLFVSMQYEVELTYTDGEVKTIWIDAEADDFTFSDASVVQYTEEVSTSIFGQMSGTRKTWRASGVGRSEMTLSTPLGDFVWKINITE